MAATTVGINPADCREAPTEVFINPADSGMAATSVGVCLESRFMTTSKGLRQNDPSAAVSTYVDACQWAGQAVALGHSRSYWFRSSWRSRLVHVPCDARNIARTAQKLRSGTYRERNYSRAADGGQPVTSFKLNQTSTIRQAEWLQPGSKSGLDHSACRGFVRRSNFGASRDALKSRRILPLNSRSLLLAGRSRFWSFVFGFAHGRYTAILLVSSFYFSCREFGLNGMRIEISSSLFVAPTD